MRDRYKGFGKYFFGFILGVWFTAIIAMCSQPARGQGLFEGTKWDHGSWSSQEIWINGDLYVVWNQDFGALSTSTVTGPQGQVGIAYGYDYGIPNYAAAQGYSIGEGDSTVDLLTVIEMNRIQDEQLLDLDLENILEKYQRCYYDCGVTNADDQH